MKYDESIAEEEEKKEYKRLKKKYCEDVKEK